MAQTNCHLRFCVLFGLFYSGSARISPLTTFKHFQNIANGLQFFGPGTRTTSVINIADDLSIGVNLGDDMKHPVHSVLGQFSQKLFGGSLVADLSITAMDSNITGDITYTRGDSCIVAEIDSSSGIVERIKYSRKSKGWSFRPIFNVKNRNIDLEASTDLSPNTNVKVSMLNSGNSTLELKHRFDEKTSVFLQTCTGKQFLKDGVFEISRSLDDANILKPKFDMKSMRPALSWVRRLSKSQHMKVELNPQTSVNITYENTIGNIATSFDIEWGNLTNTDISFSKTIFW